MGPMGLMVFYHFIENRWAKVWKIADYLVQADTAPQDLHVHQPLHDRA